MVDMRSWVVAMIWAEATTMPDSAGPTQQDMVQDAMTSRHASTQAKEQVQRKAKQSEEQKVEKRRKEAKQRAKAKAKKKAEAEAIKKAEAEAKKKAEAEAKKKAEAVAEKKAEAIAEKKAKAEAKKKAEAKAKKKAEAEAKKKAEAKKETKAAARGEARELVGAARRKISVGQYSKAMDMLVRARTLAGETAEVKTLIEKCMRGLRSGQIQDLLNSGKSAMQRKEFSKCISVAKKAMKLDASNYDAAVLLKECREMRDLDEIKF